jgi:antitoxin MazE
MTTTVVKWGNSQGIRLPKNLLKNINISENDTVELLVKDNSIIIRKSIEKKHQTTMERLIEFYGEDMTKIRQNNKPEEIDWGKPIGKEIW